MKKIAGMMWQRLALIRNLTYDAKRYLSHSASQWKQYSDAQLQARLLQKAHSIEKGLAMPEVRPGFGVAPLLELYDLLAQYEQRRMDQGHVSYHSARHAIAAYFQFHTDRGLVTPTDVEGLKALSAPQVDPALGGSRTEHRHSLQNMARGDFLSLVHARASVRTFDQTPPDLNTVREAIAIAGRSPSVCNRQGARVSIVSDPEKLKAVLEIQGGNRGFSHEIPLTLIVTCKLGVFRGARERNQGWIDGGLFSMSLLYALTYVGLGTCPLNWSATAKQDMRLRSTLDLPADENVIMLIAVGQWKDEFQVASSARLPVTHLISRTYGDIAERA